MVEENYRSQNAIIQYWGPIEELLRERFPEIVNTGSRIHRLRKLGFDPGLLEDLRRLNRERNQCMHPPYSPISDIALFSQVARRVLDGLRAQRMVGVGQKIASHRQSTVSNSRPQTLLAEHKVESTPAPLGASPVSNAVKLTQISGGDPWDRVALDDLLHQQDLKDAESCPECAALIECYEEGHAKGGGFEHWTVTYKNCPKCGWSDWSSS